MKIRPVGVELFLVGGSTDRHTRARARAHTHTHTHSNEEANIHFSQYFEGV